MSTTNHYKILGVEQDCDFKALKKAYYRRAMECHPDRHNNSQLKEEEFKLVVAAFNILSDPEKRRRFDLMEKRRASGDETSVGPVLSVMDSPGDDDLEELITGNSVPLDTTLSNLMRDLAGTEVFITFREGKNLFFQHKYRAARVCFLQSIAHSPGNIIYHAFLARACVKLHDFTGALREYQQALNLGMQRTPPQEMKQIRYELEQLRQLHSPWWYRFIRQFFPAAPSGSVDSRLEMIDETNRAIARLGAAKNKEDKPKPPKLLNK